MAKLSVIDFFCGAGGFSEGFFQQGFEIVQGIDNWRPAVETFNFNFALDSVPRDIQAFSGDIALINELPDTDVILGSPPCVSFSTSNRCGNADKALGISLIETFFRIVAVKMHQPDSKLKAWFMENVPNSARHIKPRYSFANLNLAEWARQHGKKPSETAIDFQNNHLIINSADYGVAQIRKRLFAGAAVGKCSLPELLAKVRPTQHKTLNQIFKEFPTPQLLTEQTVTDPNYPELVLSPDQLTDYAYDTGLYAVSWKGCEYLKTNHPYMGRMSFPENRENPSRTITSTKITTAREALVYENQSGYEGDGEYRTPTIREIAVLMSFPINYQFTGSEGVKWRLIGNAVCPKVSSIIAGALLKCLGQKSKRVPKLRNKVDLSCIANLNNPEKQTFSAPPIRKTNARFRRHPFKGGNLTICLSNYDLSSNGLADGYWRTTVTYGTGQGFKLQEIKPKKDRPRIRKLINSHFQDAAGFFEEVHNGFSEQIPPASELQQRFERNESDTQLNPIDLVDKVAHLVARYANGDMVEADEVFEYKTEVPKRQLYALYVLSHISAVTNKV